MEIFNVEVIPDKDGQIPKGIRGIIRNFLERQERIRMRARSRHRSRYYGCSEEKFPKLTEVGNN